MFESPYTPMLHGTMPSDGSYPDPSLMLTSDGSQSNFEFDLFAGFDELFESTSGSCTDGNVWLGTQIGEASAAQLYTSPLFSDSPAFSTLSPSPASSLSASPHSSPFCMSPALPEVHGPASLDRSGQSFGLLLERNPGEQADCTTTSPGVEFDYNEQNTTSEHIWDRSPRQDETLLNPTITVTLPSEQDRTSDISKTAVDGDQCPTRTAPFTERFRPYTPRRAARTTRRRLSVLFQEEELNDDADLQATVLTSKRMRRGKPSGRSNNVHDSDLYSRIAGASTNSRTLLPAPSTSTKRITYTDLILSNHWLTHPSVSTTLHPPPSACPSCTHGFARTGDLVRHLRAYHQTRTDGEEREKLVCKGCGTEFSRGDALTRHVGKGTCKGRKRKRRMRRWEVVEARGAEREKRSV